MKIDIFKTDKKYSVIYADPPWAYKQEGRGSAIKHYSTMETPDISGLPIKEIKTDDAILFMWATFPNLPEALTVMQQWGFTYKTAAFVWVKKNKNSNTNFWGMGAYTRANAEVCLLGISKKTNAKKCILAHDVHQIVESKIRRHSAKPPEVRDLIRKLTGGKSSYLELFARESAEDWDCWGDEAPEVGE